MVKNKKASQKDDAGPDDVKPSKGLPATGLKRNTNEWKEKHGDGAGPTNGIKRSDSVSSSSSIPSDVNDDQSSIGEEDQEGALGRGKGRHEDKIWYEGDGQRITDSPSNEEAPNLERDAPNGDGQDDATKKPPPAERNDDESLVPKEAGSSNKDGAVRDGGHGLRKDMDNLDRRREENGDGQLQGAARKSTYDDDPEQKVIGRNDARMRKLTSETGRYPDGLKAVKGEEPPGPRLDIVLDPRVSHLHVSKHLPPCHTADDSIILNVYTPQRVSSSDQS